MSFEWQMPTKMHHYRATIETDGHVLPTEKYVGLTETAFKQCYYNHLTTFRHENKSNTTELSKHIWKMTNSNISYSIKWSILKKTIPPVGRQCPLCTWEKYFTIYRPKEATINNRSELVSTCRQFKKHLLSQFK